MKKIHWLVAILLILCGIGLWIYMLVIDGVIRIDAGCDVKVEKTSELIIFKPEFESIDLTFGNESPKNDKAVIACFGAAFTGKRLNEFTHDNIASDHAGGGKVYKGYECPRNTGAFVFEQGKWIFFYGDSMEKEYAAQLEAVAKNNGCGFAQEMIIYDGKRVKGSRPEGNIFVFRTLCEKNGELLVIESERAMKYGTFINALEAYGVKHALYLDMGTWCYGWYRPNGKGIVDLHSQTHNFHTNWLVFKK